MRAGKLDRRITIERLTLTAGAAPWDSPVEAWTTHKELPAQIVQASTEEFLRNYGEADEAIVIFRTRYVAGITNADRVVYQGRTHNIREVKEIGRRVGMELRTLTYSGAT